MSRFGVLKWREIFEDGDSKRIALQKQDLSDLMILKDIKYIEDDNRGHLFDIYYQIGCDENAPVVVNIHGGGLFASYKEVNASFNYEWARRGYKVVSISYRRIPETTLWHQVDDVMHALHYIKKHADELELNIQDCYLTGDSAGALLGLFALALHGNVYLREKFNIVYSGLPFKAAGLISIMLDTQRKDLMMAIRDVVASKDEEGQAYHEYLMNPVLLVHEAKLPPLYLVTSQQDLIQKDTLKLHRHLLQAGKKHEMKNHPKGKEHPLVHVFSVAYPEYKESQEVIHLLDQYFKENGQ